MNRVYLYKLDKMKMLSEESSLIELLPKWRKEKAEAIRNEDSRFQSIAAGHLLEYAVRETIYKHYFEAPDNIELADEKLKQDEKPIETADEKLKQDDSNLDLVEENTLDIIIVRDLMEKVYNICRYDIQLIYEPDSYRVQIYKNDVSASSGAEGNVKSNIKSDIKSNIIYYSISHSGEYVAAAISDRSIGVDIEQKDDKDFKITNRMFTPEEIAYIGNDQRRFRDVWTTKEAFLKCTKEGLSVPLNSFMAEKRYIVSRGYNLNSKKYYVSTGRFEDDKYSITVVTRNNK